MNNENKNQHEYNSRKGAMLVKTGDEDLGLIFVRFVSLASAITVHADEY